MVRKLMEAHLNKAKNVLELGKAKNHPSSQLDIFEITV